MWKGSFHTRKLGEITLFYAMFTTSFGRFSELGDGEVILFQIKKLDRNIKETTPGRYFIKATARPCLRD